MSYLLDTNACVALMKDVAPVRTLYDAERARSKQVFLSSIAIFELWYGVHNSDRKESNAAGLARFLDGFEDVVPFDGEDGNVAGEIRTQLESIGKPIGPYDLLIAAQALRRDLTLVTSNVREFSRVKGLKWVDWAKTH